MDARRYVRLALTALTSSFVFLAGGPARTENGQIAPAAAGDTQIAAGMMHTCGVYGGRMRCWGRNNNGQVGDGTQSADRRMPVDVVGLGGEPLMIAAGWDNTCAVMPGGSLKCWGQNAYGQVEDGTREDRSGPVGVIGMDGGVTAVGVGHTTCAIVGGALFCWGANGNGTVGDGTRTIRLTPVAVTGLGTGVTSVAPGYQHTCAVVNEGVRCWGLNEHGELGDGTYTMRLTPVAVSGLSSGVQAVATGWYHSCGLTVAGGVKCWGHNEWGELGDGTLTSHSTPVDVVGLTSGVVAIATGGTYTCALTADAVKCWGFLNLFGTQSVATPVANLPAGVRAIAVNGDHACAVLPSQQIACWGRNQWGQLGDGFSADRLTPTLVFDWRWDGFVVGISSIPPGHTAPGGWLGTHWGTTESFVHHDWVGVPWLRYRQSGGGARPAFGDVDGDGLDEVVIGLTPVGFTNGWIAVLDDHAHHYALLRWFKVDFPSYNEANGEVFPALGDVDGDGRAEIVAGLGTGGRGWYEIFDDAVGDYQHLAWGQVPWTYYFERDGSTHPAVADLDGDGRSEIVLGLGPGSNGWVEIVNSAAFAYSHRAWIQAQWIAYSAANGTTYPAAGDLDGDGKAEIVLGLGEGGGGWFEVLDDATQSFAHLTWRQISWPAYNAAAGELHPAVGQIDADDRMEVVFGLAPHAGDGGWFLVIDDATTSYAHLGWRNLDWRAFRDSGGGTFPAIGRRR